MSEDIVAYVHKGCKTSSRATDLMDERGVVYTKRELFEETPSREELRRFISAMGISARDLLRPRDRNYREMKLRETNLSDEELLDLMVSKPGLIRRPILIQGERVALGLKPEDVVRFLGLTAD